MKIGLKFVFAQIFWPKVPSNYFLHVYILALLLLTLGRGSFSCSVYHSCLLRRDFQQLRNAFEIVWPPPPLSHSQAIPLEASRTTPRSKKKDAVRYCIPKIRNSTIDHIYSIDLQSCYGL